MFNFLLFVWDEFISWSIFYYVHFTSSKSLLHLARAAIVAFGERFGLDYSHVRTRIINERRVEEPEKEKETRNPSLINANVGAVIVRKYWTRIDDNTYLLLLIDFLHSHCIFNLQFAALRLHNRPFARLLTTAFIIQEIS